MRKTPKQYLFLGLGSLSVVLAAIGLFLPVLPTTPFILLAAFFFANSSKHLYEWLVEHPYFGKYLYSYLKFKAVDPRVKIHALIILWVGLIASGLVLQNNWLWFGLLVIGIGVTLHISSLKPLTDEQLQELETARLTSVSEKFQG